MTVVKTPGKAKATEAEPATVGEAVIKIRPDTDEFEGALAKLIRASRPADSPSAAAKALTFHPKVTSAGLGGSVAVVVLYCLATYAHQDFPDYAAAAITTIVTTLCGWLAPAEKSTT